VCLAGCLAAFALTGAFFRRGGPLFGPNAALYDFSILGASWTLQVEFLAIPFILIGIGASTLWRRRIVLAYAIFAAILCEPWLRTHVVTYRRFLSCFLHSGS